MIPAAGRFKDKVVMVTGAVGGIGAATCDTLAQQGADVVALDLPGADFSRLTHTIEALGRRIMALEMDVTQEGDWQRVMQQVTAAWGGVDVLVNNAGIAGPLGRFEACTLDAFERTLAVNVRGVFLGMQAVIPSMRARGGGSIINISSISGERGNPRVLPYVASKHAVNGMTKCAALDLVGDKIRVNAVSPSPTNTNMMKLAEDQLVERLNITPDAAHRALAAGGPMGRYGEPAEIAAVIAFLASSEASFITGAIVGVDGGMLA